MLPRPQKDREKQPGIQETRTNVYINQPSTSSTLISSSRLSVVINNQYENHHQSTDQERDNTFFGLLCRNEAALPVALVLDAAAAIAASMSELTEVLVNLGGLLLVEDFEAL